MKFNRNFILVFILLVVVAALYRVIPDRPFGFAPHWALALFGGSMIKDKKWAFALPVFSLFISDLLYQFLYIKGLTDIPGFYDGILWNYGCFVVVTCVAFMMRRVTVGNVLTYSFLCPTVFFLVSNFGVWAAGAGLKRPGTFFGLMQTYMDALPFYRGSILATLVFSTVLFGAYMLMRQKQTTAITQ